MAGADADIRKWIISVRGDESKNRFADRICHFQVRNDRTVCLHYGRGTITNWESGATSPPRDVETILSIALLEFDKSRDRNACDSNTCDSNIHDSGASDRSDSDSCEFCTELANERYFFARKRLNEMTGLDLWCRNLHDAVLIQVCRGLLTFDELPGFEESMLTAIRQVTLTGEEKNELAIERKTAAISKDLINAPDIGAVYEMITGRYAGYFAAQHWLAGARFRKIYEKRNRFCEMRMPLRMAIVNLAPNYINSYNNMFNGSFLGRDWLIDLCRHLRFSADEINEVLEATHNVQLDAGAGLPGYYSFMEGKSLYERFVIMLLAGIRLADAADADAAEIHPVKGSCRAAIADSTELPPPDYLLDPFRSSSGSVRPVIRAFERFIGENGSDGVETDELLSRSFAADWVELVDRPRYDEMYSPEVLELYKSETPHYYELSGEQAAGLRNYRREAVRLHFFAALAYTVLTGRVYQGTYRDPDLDEIRRLFRAGDPEAQPLYDNIFRFISQILGTFLGNGPIHETPDGRFHVFNASTGKLSRRGLDLDTIIEDLWDSALIIRENTP